MVDRADLIDRRLVVVIDETPLDSVAAAGCLENDVARSDICRVMIADAAQVDDVEGAQVCLDRRVRVTDEYELGICVPGRVTTRERGVRQFGNAIQNADGVRADCDIVAEKPVLVDGSNRFKAPGPCPVWMVVTPKLRIHSTSFSRG